MRLSMVGLLLLAGTTLPCGAQGAGPEAAVGAAQPAVQPMTAEKQGAMLQKRKGRTVSKASAKQVDPKPQQQGVQESAPVATDQPVQLRGVRG